MAAEDYGYDFGDLEQWDYDDPDASDPFCQHCDAGPLEWRELPSGKFRLWDAEKKAWHVCPPSFDFAPTEGN